MDQGQGDDPQLGDYPHGAPISPSYPVPTVYVLEAALAVLGAVVGLLGAGLTIHRFWTTLVRPRLKPAKLRRAYALIEGWYDEIDRNLTSGLNMDRLQNMEDRIATYLRDHDLENYPLRFSRRFRRRFLKHCGYSRQLRDSEDLFRKYARSPAEGTDLGSWWLSTAGMFYRFHANYKAQGPDANFADVKMAITLLKMYLRVKID